MRSTQWSALWSDERGLITSASLKDDSARSNPTYTKEERRELLSILQEENNSLFITTTNSKYASRGSSKLPRETVEFLKKLKSLLEKIDKNHLNLALTCDGLSQEQLFQSPPSIDLRIINVHPRKKGQSKFDESWRDPLYVLVMQNPEFPSLDLGRWIKGAKKGAFNYFEYAKKHRSLNMLKQQSDEEKK